MAAFLQRPAETALGLTSAASPRQDSGAGLETGLRQHKQPSQRPATAETSRECFARMEALAGQASGHTGAILHISRTSDQKMH
jgi:hypothetical protein